MRKYVAFERQGGIYLEPIDKASFTPAGWHTPHQYSTLDGLVHMKTQPSVKCQARVCLPGLNVFAKNVRLVDEQTATELDQIDAEILNLKKRRFALINENFRTFPLIQEGDLKRSYEKSFLTKTEATSVKERNK